MGSETKKSEKFEKNFYFVSKMEFFEFFWVKHITKVGNDRNLAYLGGRIPVGDFEFLKIKKRVI